MATKPDATKTSKAPFQIQKGMLQVCYALTPLAIASVYLFGWRSLALLAVSFACGVGTEAFFALRAGKQITSAVFVSCMIFALSLPPTLPLWMAAVGMVVGVGIGKMAFGGFGQNIFNPAMVGRCFLYVTFPIQMTNQWATPFTGFPGGLAAWAGAPDALTKATPLRLIREGDAVALSDLLVGTTAGSLGETSVLLVVLGGAYILYKKVAPWRLALSCVVGGLLASFLLQGFRVEGVAGPLETLLAGSFLFGAAFVVTEPITGAKTVPGQWIYGSVIGALTVFLRTFSNFSEGIMFSVLLMNAFVPILDRSVRNVKALKASPAKAGAT